MIPAALRYDFGHFRRGLAGRLSPLPPLLPEPYTAADFGAFMRAEVYRFSARYARNRVVVDGGALAHLNGRGAILAFLHYGSFFLSGGALVHQLGLPYTAIASNRNLHPSMMSEHDIRFWLYTHKRSRELYRQRLFLSAESPRPALRWLQDGGLLGVALDVREIGHRHQEYPVPCGEKTYYLQDGPERLARIAGVPMLPMSIRYVPEEGRHQLRVGEAVSVEHPDGAATRAMFDWLMADPLAEPRQMFHSLDCFEQPAHV